MVTHSEVNRVHIGSSFLQMAGIDQGDSVETREEGSES